MPAYNINEKAKEIRVARESYGEVVAAMEILNNKATLETRDFTDDEQAEYEKLSRTAKSLSAQADRLEELHHHNTGAWISKRNSEPFGLDGNIGDNDSQKDLNNLQVRAYQTFEDWLSNGGEARESEYKNIAKELRAASAFSGQNMTTQTEGGYLAPHEKLHNDLIGLLNKKNIIRAHANILSLEGTDKLTIPALADTGGDAEWIAENDASPESKMTFKQMSITLNRLSKTIPISRHLIKNTAFNITNIIAENLATAMANSMERAYLNGDGVGKPFGIFNTTNGGIPTTRDINVGTSTNLIDYDGLIDAESMLHEADKQNAVWILSTKALAELRKLKDKNGGLVFQESMLVGEPKRLLGYPIYVSDRIAEGGIIANEYVGFLANLKNYYIIDNTAIELFVYNERFQSNYAIGLQTDMFTGGAPVRPEAFVRLKAGTATASRASGADK